jgi:DNA-binding NarL/FixJ family response regulator
MKTIKPRTPRKPVRKVFLVDDHPMVRQGLAQLIGSTPDLSVCGEAPDAAQALDGIQAKSPDLAIVDISLPGRSGLELIKDLRSLLPGLPILVISMHDESLYVERVLRAGGRGYIMKQEGGEKILKAMRQVLGGQIYVSEKMSTKLLEIFSGRRVEASSSPVEFLTDREFEVFQLIGQGRSTREIAGHLHLSVKTVEVHRLNIKQKLQVSTANELIRYAVRWIESR